MTQFLIDQETHEWCTAEIRRLRCALEVCMHTLSLTEPSDAEMHAAQYASGAGLAQDAWKPEYVHDDLPDFQFRS